MTATPHGHLAPARCSGCQTAPCTCPSVLRSGPPPCHRPRCWPHWGASVVGPLAAPRAGGVCPLDPQHRGAWLCAGGSWGPPRGCPRPLPGGCPTSRGPHPAHYARPIVLQVGSESLGRDHSGSRAQGPPPRASGSNSDRGGQVGLAGARGVLAAQLWGRPASEATARAPRLAPLPTSTSGQLGVSRLRTLHAELPLPDSSVSFLCRGRLSGQEMDFLALPLPGSPSRGSSSCSKQNSLRPPLRLFPDFPAPQR